MGLGLGLGLEWRACRIKLVQARAQPLHFLQGGSGMVALQVGCGGAGAVGTAPQ